ncbi:RodZ domain-containing protein [Streptomonospora wellingtoniae]|uniref:DUF4115 domain-containing protein n=1 Tax=Streptomonospora wellingtoniae TaxID=3075544 RepID=A0ABU2KRD0_9ACTN|nr:RodZ domain-containing protein [Streptomonospora sp. DSM 45055]MDT0301824.1 DUF4115 domain-containing protein [Streptomonospora sp. DSM 45055]
MGRHRNDPRGIAQMVAIGGVIVLFITLVILGGFFLYKSLPSGSDTAAVPEGAAGTTADPQAEEMPTGSLYIRAVGESSEVVVTVPGGDVLADTTLKTDEYLSFTEERTLSVTIGRPSEVEIYVHGERQDVEGEDPGYSFAVQP